MYAIDNRIPLGIALAFYPYAIFAGLGLGEIALRKAVMLALVVPTALIVVYGNVPGGIVKCMVAAFPSLGVIGRLAFVTLSFLVGFALACLLVTFGQKHRE